MATYSKRDLSSVPFMSFSFVESYIKSLKASSGGKPISRGFMYFLESFVHDLQGELYHFIFTIVSFCLTLQANRSNLIISIL